MGEMSDQNFVHLTILIRKEKVFINWFLNDMITPKDCKELKICWNVLFLITINKTQDVASCSWPLNEDRPVWLLHHMLVWHNNQTTKPSSCIAFEFYMSYHKNNFSVRCLFLHKCKLVMTFWLHGYPLKAPINLEIRWYN